MWQCLLLSKVMWQRATEPWKASCRFYPALWVVSKAAGKISAISFNLISSITVELGEQSRTS